MPLWASYGEPRALSTKARFAAGFALGTLGCFWILFLEPDPLHAARVFWDRTFGWQVGRDSPFSIWGWGQYHAQGIPDLGKAQPVAILLLLAGSVATFFWPRRKTVLQLAALTGAILIGFELTLTHWFYLYIPWFLPFVAYAVLASDDSPSRSRPVEPLLAALAAGLASILFLTSWALIHRGFYKRDQIVDTPVYHRYGTAMDDGRVPYRDFGLEYPPGALPVFVLPALGDADFQTFTRRFEGFMAVCGLALVAFVAAALVALGAGARRLAAALGFVALAPLAVGSVVLSRFDLWPAALTAAALAALLSGRERLGHGALGLAIAAKLYPAVLAPLAVAYVWKREGRREAMRCGAIMAGATAIVVLPFLVLSPGGVWDSLTRQASRPLQIESLGSAFLLAAHQAFGLDITMDSSHGSQNLAGTLPDVLAIVQSLVAGGRAGRDLGRLRPGARGQGTVRPRVRGRPDCVHRAREGALAAVPDLADPGCPAGSGPPWAHGVGPARGRARPDAALVPVSLLGARAGVRRGRVVARPRARPRPARPAGRARSGVTRAAREWPRTR